MDDGSKDSTRDEIREFASNRFDTGFIFLSRNFGKEHAMLAGIQLLALVVHAGQRGLVTSGAAGRGCGGAGRVGPIGLCQRMGVPAHQAQGHGQAQQRMEEGGVQAWSAGCLRRRGAAGHLGC